MDVCLLSKMYPPVKGGSGAYAYEIANALGARGHAVDVFTQATGDTSKAPIQDNVTVHRVTKARRYLVTFETMYYSLRSRFAVDFDAYDVIHGTLMPASPIALADHPFETPLVLTSHSFALSEVFAHSAEKPADYLLKYAFHPMNVVMDNVAARAADEIVAISDEMAGQLTDRYRLPAEKITTIPHGVDTDRYRPRDDHHPAVSEDRLTLLFVGRLITRKGVDLAIESLAETDAREVELLVAGTGRLEDELQQLASDLNVADRVEFLGYVPDDALPILYSSADVTLFTSNYEGFGLVWLESLAAGTPVIGTPVGGIPDLIDHGTSGYVVEHDPSAIAPRVDHLSDDREKLAAMSEAARSVAEEHTWDHVARNVEAVYERLLDDE